MIVSPPHIARVTALPLVAHLSDDLTLALACAFEFVVQSGVGGMHVLRRPVAPLPPLDGVGRLRHVHPAVRAQRAWYDAARGDPLIDTALATPLARVAVYAAYLADGWTPALHERAAEISGQLQDDGTPTERADREAVRRVRALSRVPRVCATCRHYWQLHPTATHGACRRHDTPITPEHLAPQCYDQAPTVEAVQAAYASLPPAPLPTTWHRVAYPYTPTQPAP